MCPSMGLTVSREHTCLHAEKCSCLRAREDIWFFQAEDCMRYIGVTGVQTCALPILIPLRRRVPEPTTTTRRRRVSLTGATHHLEDVPLGNEVGERRRRARDGYSALCRAGDDVSAIVDRKSVV